MGRGYSRRRRTPQRGVRPWRRTRPPDRFEVKTSLHGRVLRRSRHRRDADARFRAPRRRAGAQDRGTGPRQRRRRRAAPADRAAGGARARAAAEDLRRAVALAEGAALPPSGPALHARLHRAPVRGLHRAARRPPLRRRSRDGRRLRHVRRHAGAGRRPPEGAQHEGEGAAQLRPAQARGLPQGAAPDGAGRAHRAVRSSASSTRRAPTRASTPRSAARPRRSRRTSR